MSAPTAYPLAWPPGWPKTEASRRESGAFRCTLPSALKKLQDEVRLLGGKGLILSSNYTLGAANPADPGVVAYFQHDAVPIAIPCDRWARIEANVQAIALTVEAMRGMNRWGAKHMLRAMFQGFRALPAAKTQRQWWEVLGVAAHTCTEDVHAAYRAAAKRAHPDSGGSTEAMAEINEAMARFRVERGLKA